MKYIIDFVDTVPQEEINTYLSRYKLTVVNTYDSFGKVYLVEGDSTPPVTDLIENIEDDRDLSLDFEELFSIPVNDDNWWKIVSYGDEELTPDTTEISVNIDEPFVDVYLLDSGVGKTHQEFVGQTITDLYTVTPGDFDDSVGHGTAMASLITGNTCAMARANLFNVKIYSNTGTITLGELLNALDAVKADSDSKPTVNAVANMSWIIARNDYVNKKIQQLIDSGICVVAAAGNQGKPISDLTPASIADAFTIGAYNQDLKPADFSNYTGPGTVNNIGVVDRWAPGVDIRVASINPNALYQMSSGTSAATAIATGAICFNSTSYGKAYLEVFNEAPIKTYPSNESMPYLVAQRTGLLTLSEPYDLSVNKIITYSIKGDPRFIMMWNEYTKGTTSTTKIVRNSTPTIHFLYPSSEVAKITSTDLPEGFKIIDGWLCVDIRLPDDLKYQLYRFTVELETSAGQETTIYVEFLRVADAVEDYSELLNEPDLSQDIEIMLQGSCVSGDFSPCSNDCPNDPISADCSQGSGKTIPCGCQPI